MRRALALAAAWIVAQSACAQGAPEVKRGITGELTFRYAGAELTTTQQDLSAPLLLRLERTGEDEYTARFIGAVEGDHDLRSLIRHRTGETPVDLAPIPVTIVSHLPDRIATDLYEALDLDIRVSGGYRAILLALAALWLAVPVVFIVRRLLRSAPAQEAAVVAPEPSLADQLRPLVEAAAARQLTVAERGRLELLFVHYWRERAAPGAENVAEAIHVLRHHAEAGELLETVERWLHHPDRSAHDPTRLEQLLAPYAERTAVEETAAESEAETS